MNKESILPIAEIDQTDEIKMNDTEEVALNSDLKQNLLDNNQQSNLKIKDSTKQSSNRNKCCIQLLLILFVLSLLILFIIGVFIFIFKKKHE